MELRHLRYFLAVAQEEHFGRAAEKLHIVQPALSMQIKTLETEFGGPLFTRTSRRVELTEAGKLLRTMAQQTLEQIEHTRLSVERAIRGETGRIRIGFAGNAVFSGKMMQDMRTFRKRYPDAELIIQEMAPHLQTEALLNGQLDIGYMPDYSKGRHLALHHSYVGEWGRLVAMSSEHLFAEKEEITVEMLANEPLIFYSTNDADTHLFTVIENVLGHAPSSVSYSSSTLTVLAMAAAGLGLALVPSPVAHIKIPGVTYRKLAAPALSANLMRVNRKEETNGAVLAFLALVRQ